MSCSVVVLMRNEKERFIQLDPKSFIIRVQVQVLGSNPIVTLDCVFLIHYKGICGHHYLMCSGLQNLSFNNTITWYHTCSTKVIIRNFAWCYEGIYNLGQYAMNQMTSQTGKGM